jgi:hypothetical protein
MHIRLNSFAFSPFQQSRSEVFLAGFMQIGWTCSWMYVEERAQVQAELQITLHSHSAAFPSQVINIPVRYVRIGRVGSNILLPGCRLLNFR